MKSGTVPRQVDQVVDLPLARSARATPDMDVLVLGLKSRDPVSEAQFLRLFSALVERTLCRILGIHHDLEDLVQEVFLRVLRRLSTLDEPRALPGFVTSTAVFVAREAIRSRKRRSWLLFLAPPDLPQVPAAASEEAQDSLRAFYTVVRTLDEIEQVAFTLRFVEGMELTELAAVCGVSLASIKRLLRSAKIKFIERAARYPELDAWLEEGSPWTTP
jgi:RNA polymerase sigma-70 factor (ECF subfamily)